MPTAHGFVKFVDSRLVGTFDVDGSKRYLSIDVQPNNQPFECNDATLTYVNVDQLVGSSMWTGTVGRDNFQIGLLGGVFIAGPLVVARSVIRIRGAGTWGTVEVISPPTRANALIESRGNGDNFVVNQNPNFNVVSDSPKLQREKQLLASGNPIIAIFGQSGSGKSTFINLITTEQQRVGGGLHSCTRDITIVEANINGRPVVVIDTPGIDDTHLSVKEADVLMSIAKQLGDMGRSKVWVTGVLFLHRVSDIRFSQTAQRISIMLKNLCGDVAMSHLMLCTTMWDSVPEDEGNRRFNELCETGAWKEMISKGAGTAIISSMSPSAKAEAEGIVSQLIKNARPVEVAIQDEIVNQNLKVVNTSAGKVLDEGQKQQAESDRRVHKLARRRPRQGCVIQ